jgi:hypothetical protein
MFVYNNLWDYNICMGEMTSAHKIKPENQKGRNQLEDLGMGEKILLQWILKKEGRMV